MENLIRNFCIIAHIDHGKSTLADRFLELTQTISKRELREQFLDQMELERERGITIKMQPVRMKYHFSPELKKRFGADSCILNLIDTPGHVDFSYEVRRSLAAVEGAVLLVDASQGVQAQTVANYHLACEEGLKVIPVINKIDLPAADVEGSRKEIRKLLNCQEEEILLISAKTGQGVKKLLEEIVKRIPPPFQDKGKSLKALIFDSIYDEYRGVIVFFRVFQGEIKEGDCIYFLRTQKETRVEELGYLTPFLIREVK